MTSLARGLLLAAALAGCSSELPRPSASDAALVGGGLLVASKASYLKPEYLGAALLVYALYDPLAPTWEVQAGDMDKEGDRVRIALRMKALHVGGDGEARQVFRSTAERLAQERGFSGYAIVAYEEGVESSRPLAHRIASGEVRLLRSRTWPDL